MTGSELTQLERGYYVQQGNSVGEWPSGEVGRAKALDPEANDVNLLTHTLPPLFVLI